MNWVDEEIAALPADIRARFVYISGLIEEFGLARIREPYVKHLQGKLWEMRLTGRDGIARAIYVTASRERVVVVEFSLRRPRRRPSANWNWHCGEQRRFRNEQSAGIASRMDEG